MRMVMLLLLTLTAALGPQSPRRLRPRQNHSVPASSPTPIAEPSLRTATRSISSGPSAAARTTASFCRGDRRAAGACRSRSTSAATSPISIRRYRETAGGWSSAPIGRFRGGSTGKPNAHVWSVEIEPIAGRSTPAFVSSVSLPGHYHSWIEIGFDDALYFRRTTPDWKKTGPCGRHGQDRAMRRRSRTPTSNAGRAGART